MNGFSHAKTPRRQELAGAGAAWSPDEVAGACGVSRSTVKRALAAGELGSFKMRGQRRSLEEDVVRFVLRTKRNGGGVRLKPGESEEQVRRELRAWRAENADFSHAKTARPGSIRREELHDLLADLVRRVDRLEEKYKGSRIKDKSLSLSEGEAA